MNTVRKTPTRDEVHNFFIPQDLLSKISKSGEKPVGDDYLKYRTFWHHILMKSFDKHDLKQCIGIDDPQLDQPIKDIMGILRTLFPMSQGGYKTAEERLYQIAANNQKLKPSSIANLTLWISAINDLLVNYTKRPRVRAGFIDSNNLHEFIDTFVVLSEELKHKPIRFQLDEHVADIRN